jgi:hypothetical protein
MIAVDFFTVDAVWLQRLGSRRVHLAGCTPHPNATWVTQQARQFTWTLRGCAEPWRFLIRDRDQNFTTAFDKMCFAATVWRFFVRRFVRRRRTVLRSGSCGLPVPSVWTGC